MGVGGSKWVGVKLGESGWRWMKVGGGGENEQM